MFQSAARDSVYMEHCVVRPASNDAYITFYGAPHWERDFIGLPETTAQDTAQRSSAGCAYGVMNESAGLMIGWNQGHIPFGQVYVPFGYGMDDDYWDIRKSGSGKLSLQGGGAPDLDEYVRVFCQQVRGY